MQQSLKSEDTKYHFKCVKVPDIAPYWKAWIVRPGYRTISFASNFQFLISLCKWRRQDNKIQLSYWNGCFPFNKNIELIFVTNYDCVRFLVCCHFQQFLKVYQWLSKTWTVISTWPMKPWPWLGV